MKSRRLVLIPAWIVQYGIVVPIAAVVLALIAGLAYGENRGVHPLFLILFPIVGWTLWLLFIIASLRGPGSVSDVAASSRRSAAEVWSAGQRVWSPWGLTRPSRAATLPAQPPSWRVAPPS